MLIGYMRVSSTDDRQSVDLQRDALVAAGVDSRHLFSDKATRHPALARTGRACGPAEVVPVFWTGC
jgi:DNA invertase Pin-like site-specific DNA recombinase